VLLLSELILEPLLLGGCRLADLLELSLKADNPPLFLYLILQQVGPTFGPLRTIRSSTSFQTHTIK
jgi:hypothetical protein